MSFKTVNQQNQQLHYSPLPPHFNIKFSPIHRDSRLTSSCKIITNYYIYDPPNSNTTCKTIYAAPSKTFLDPYINALYHQEFNKFQTIQYNQPFTLSFD